MIHELKHIIRTMDWYGTINGEVFETKLLVSNSIRLWSNVRNNSNIGIEHILLAQLQIISFLVM